MPTLIAPPMPEDVVTSIEVIGNRARTALLRALSAADGPLTTADLALVLDTNRVSAMRHLLALEEIGLVVGDPGSGAPRRGVSVRWQVRPDQIDAIARAWTEYAHGRGPQNTDNSSSSDDSAP